VKCVRCRKDCRRRDVRDNRCPGCGQAFALANHTETPIRDYLLHLAIERVSSRGSVFFGRDNLYHEVRRRLGKRQSDPLSLALGFVGVVLIVVVVATRHIDWAILILPTAVGFVYARLRQRYFDGLSRPAFERALGLYLKAHGAPPKLLEPASAARQVAPFDPRAEQELAHYSFDRAVICDRSETVDLLIANQFHFENNCAVLGIDGYPPQGFALVRRMLRNNPRILVLVLHDATEDGCQLAQRLREDPDWFRDQGTVVDVGLRPAHAKYFPKLQEGAIGGRVEPGRAISPSEAEWLSKFALSLGVIPPEQIIKRLFRAIHSSEQAVAAGVAGAVGGDVGGDGGGVILFGTHADASDGGGDSFG